MRRHLRRNDQLGGLLLLLFLIPAVLCGTSLAATTTLTFDQFPSGTVLTTQYQSLGVTIAGANVVTSCSRCTPFPSLSGTNVAYAPAGLMTLTFDATVIGGSVQAVSAYVTDPGEPAGIYAYDASNNLLGQAVLPGIGGTNVLLSVTSPGNPIAYVTIYDGGGLFAIDNFSFSAPLNAPPPVSFQTAANYYAAANPSVAIPYSEREVVARAPIAESYGRLPLAFEANRGQLDPQAEFVARSAGVSVFLTKKSAVLQLTRPQSKNALVDRHVSTDLETAVLQLQLLGSRDNASIRGERELAGRVNYLIGKDPKAWHTAIPTFGQVRYEGVYPGVDLVYYGNRQRLEYDFVIAPGADPDAIGMRIEGAQKLEVDRAGGLIAHLADGDLRWERPTCYQLNEGSRVPVDSKFVVTGNRVRFHVDSYDRTRQLVIDPVLVYSTYIGAVSNQRLGVALDPSGSLYVATTSTSVSPYPTTAGAYQTSNPAGVISGTISKLSADGSTLLYSTYLGNGTVTNLYGLAVDAAGDAYVTGDTGYGFPTTADAYQAQCAATGAPPQCIPTPAFVAELNPQGNGLVYSTYLTGSTSGGRTSSSGVGVAVDASGNIYVAGLTTDTTFPTLSAYQANLGDLAATCGGACGDFFVAKLGVPSGGGNKTLLYSTYFGGSFQDSPEIANGGGNVIATDGSGKVFVGGYTASSDFPTLNAYKSFCGTVANPCNTTSGFQTRNDAVFFELDTTQSGAASLVYSTYIGGSNPDSVSAIALDSTGKAYLAGWTQSTTDFKTTTGAFQTSCASINQNPFLMKFDTTQAAAGSLLWSTCLGFNGAAYGLALDSAGNPYVSTDTNDGVFPAANLVNAIQSDTGNLYIGELNGTGTSLLWGTRFGSSSVQAFNAGIAIDSSSNVYIGGVTTFSGSSTDLPTTLGSFAPNCIIGANATGCGVSTAGAPALFAAKIAPTSGTFPVATPRSLTFAALSPGSTSASQTFVFRNIGDTPLTINSISITGTNASEFSILSPPGCTTGTLAGGASCTDSIAFAPVTSGNKQATLVIDPAGVLDNVALTGIGTPTVPPVASNESVSTLSNTRVTIALQATDSAGFSLTYAINSLPSNGTLGAVSGSTVTYTPNAGFTGSDSFTYIANDGFLNSNVATVSITVANANSSTSTSVSSSLNPSSFGQTVTLTATVTSTGGTPTGNVAFMDGANSLGSVVLTSGTAFLTTSSLTTGSHSITTTYTPTGNFTASTSSALSQTVNQATPLITWATPAAIIYGTALSATQLNATANVAGSFAYSPASGAVLNVGTQTLTAVFTPSDATDYTGASATVSLVVSQAVSKVGVTSSINPSNTGQLVTFAAFIYPQIGGTATGTVTFSDGATTLGTSTVSGNSAALSTSALAAGTHSITAAYSGDLNVLASTSSALSQVVNASQIATTTTVFSSVNPAYVTQTVVYTATVSAASGVPTGNVTFRQGSATLAAVALVNGQAVYSTSYATTGTRYITASYAGNGPYLASTSTVLAESVTRVPTTIVVASSVSPQLVGLPITFTATLSSPAGVPADGETVTFRDRGTAIGTGTTTGGVATFTTSSLSAGTHSITARYGGDTTFASSTSGTISQVVSKYASSTSVASNPNPSSYGQPVTFTATVLPTGPFAPTGTVAFKSGRFTLATVTLSSGSASYTTSTLNAGVRSITAVYSGDSDNASSTSPVLSQTVNKATTTTTLTAAPNPSTLGQTVTLTATVTSPGGTPTGTVTFRTGTAFIGSASLNAGVATITTSTLPRGTLTLTGTYNGNANFAGSVGSTSQTVN